MSNTGAFCFESYPQGRQIRILWEAIVSLEARLTNNVPPSDEQVYAYYAGTNNIASITYKNLAATVAVRNFTYTVQPPIADNALIQGQTLTIS